MDQKRRDEQQTDAQRKTHLAGFYRKVVEHITASLEIFEVEDIKVKKSSIHYRYDDGETIEIREIAFNKDKFTRKMNDILSKNPEATPKKITQSIVSRTVRTRKLLGEELDRYRHWITEPATWREMERATRDCKNLEYHIQHRSKKATNLKGAELSVNTQWHFLTSEIEDYFDRSSALRRKCLNYAAVVDGGSSLSAMKNRSTA